MKRFALTVLKNLPLMILSLLAAFVIWLFAVSSSDPTEEGRFPQNVAIEVKGLGDGLVLTNDLPLNVNINLRAPSSIWRRMSLEKVTGKATIDLTGLEAGEYEVPVQVQIGISPIHILSYSPQTVTVKMERYETREYEIKVKELGEIPTAFKAEPPVLSSDKVTISGPVSQLDRISEVRVLLDHSNATSSIEKVLSVNALTDSNLVIKDVAISPEKITLTQEINMRGGYRILSVKLVTKGELQSGYRVTNIGVDPVYATVYCSDRSLLDSFPSYIETTPVDLSEITENTSRKISLMIPDGATLVGDQNVNLNVAIEEIEGTITLSEVPIKLIGEDENLQAQYSPETIDVYLTGPVNELNNVTMENVSAIVDLKDLGPGSYQIEPLIEISTDKEVQVQSVLPAAIEVTMTEPVPDVEPEGEEKNADK